MGFWQLFVFIHVVDCKSFSEAAKACKLTQPTVSSHIKQLEDHLECVLIDRIGKTAVATQAGLILYRYAKQLLELREETESAISKYRGDMKGKVSIGGSTIPGVFIMPPLLARFRENYSQVTFFLDIGSSEAIIQKIHRGTLELGIVGTKTNLKSIHQRKIIEDELMLVVPENHKWSTRKTIHFDLLKKEPFIKRESGSGTWESFCKSLEKEGVSEEDLTIVAEIKQTSGVVSAIKNQLGISILSPIAIAHDLEANRLHALKIEAIDLKRRFYLTWNGHRTLSPIGETLKVFIEDSFPIIP